METLKRIVMSSSDPESVSLFVKSLVAFAVLFGLDSTVVNEGGGYLTNLIVGFGMIVSAGTGLWGLGRKMKFGRWSATPSDNYSDN